MAAEDPRFLLHFKTLAKFNEKLADGTVSADKHLVFIKDAKQVWFKGTYYADNVKMDGITDFYNGWSITQSSATTLTITLTGKRWNANTRVWEAISKPLSVNSVTQSVAGLMSAADKVKLDGLNINNVSNISFSSNAAKVTATISKDNGNAADTSTTVNLPVASSTSAGSMSATDKIELDRISTANFALGAVTPTTSTVGIAASKTTISSGASAANNITLPAATQSVAGVMTAADKVKLDVTLPNLIDSNKTNIDNYTVNGFKISTNPVLDGADIKITGYTKPSTTGALAAADSVNGALGKLEKKLDDEVTSRTNAVSNLTNTVNSNKSTIDNYTINGAKISTNPKITVTVGGSGNAVTTASFSGTVLTLTKGATYNNYSHPAGSGASKSTGLYKFSTDSTSHISGVTAVTKSDITALGIPSSDTNTTYSFSSGNGGFTVTPSGGSTQTVSIGKPSTAGTADKVANTLTFTGYQSKSYNGSAAVSVAIPSRVSDLTNDSGYITSYTDTKNTTGSTNSSSKLYLVGATSQASSPVTYSNSGVYTQSGAVYASAGFYDTSDMRVKDNIESIDVSKADKIRLVEFDRTDREHHGYGVIAQELETVYPSMVNTDENGFKTVNYSEIYAVKIKYLEDKIAALEAVVDKLISK
nr:MAG: chaperone of endosialidase [Bacteriophage sp.]